MPHLTIAEQTYAVEAGQRLVQAIEEAGINIGHRCGGFARCTTCRVEFHAGEPETMTRAEYDKLNSQGNLDKFRLSCQIVCEQDMELAVLMTQEEMGWDDSGPAVEPTVTPEAVFIPKSDFSEF
jgi:ferredoxin